MKVGPSPMPYRCLKAPPSLSGLKRERPIPLKTESTVPDALLFGQAGGERGRGGADVGPVEDPGEVAPGPPL